jgi:hypothetical protein
MSDFKRIFVVYCGDEGNLPLRLHKNYSIYKEIKEIENIINS